MQMQSQAGVRVAEQTRALFDDLTKLKTTHPGDAAQIAAQILNHIKSQFGDVTDLLTL